MDLNNKKRKGGVALASRRLGRVEKGQPLILGANKMEGGYNFAVEASEDSEVSLLLYKKRGAAAPVEIVFPKDFHTGRVWALKLCSASLRDFEYNYKIDGEIVQIRMHTAFTGESISEYLTIRKRRSAVASLMRMFPAGKMKLHRQ